RREFRDVRIARGRRNHRRHDRAARGAAAPRHPGARCRRIAPAAARARRWLVAPFAVALALYLVTLPMAYGVLERSFACRRDGAGGHWMRPPAGRYLVPAPEGAERDGGDAAATSRFREAGCLVVKLLTGKIFVEGSGICVDGPDFAARQNSRVQ